MVRSDFVTEERRRRNECGMSVVRSIDIHRVIKRKGKKGKERKRVELVERMQMMLGEENGLFPPFSGGEAWVGGGMFLSVRYG